MLHISKTPHNKTSEKEMIELCKNKGYTYLSSYSGTSKTNKKKQTYVNFTCNLHSNYGVQTKALHDIKRLKKPCNICNHSKLRHTFKEEMSKINPNIEILSNYVDWNTKIKCKCKIDNNEWETVPSVLLYGGGCVLCSIQRKSVQQIEKSRIQFYSRMKEIQPHITFVTEYIGAHKPITCYCELDNTEWQTLPCNLLNQTSGCPTCKKNKARQETALTLEEVVKRIKKLHPNVEILSDYINANSVLECKCNIHNYYFETKARNLLYKNSHGCPRCIQSKGEQKLLSILETFEYEVVAQYSIPECKHINPLRFDAFWQEKNIAFEYQGQQHYYPVDFAGRGEEWAKKQFEINSKRDKIKKEYCEKNNIQLIEIPYWEYDNMEKFIKNIIKQ